MLFFRAYLADYFFIVFFFPLMSFSVVFFFVFFFVKKINDVCDIIFSLHFFLQYQNFLYWMSFHEIKTRIRPTAMSCLN